MRRCSIRAAKRLLKSKFTKMSNYNNIFIHTYFISLLIMYVVCTFDVHISLEFVADGFVTDYVIRKRKSIITKERLDKLFRIL